MHDIIKKEFGKLNIGIVYVFGSTAQGLDGKNSDIDIGVVFIKPPENSGQFIIYEKLYSIFSEDYREKEIDIVFLQSASLSLQLNAIKYGEIIYEVSAKFRADYEDKIMLLHSDFEPVLMEFDKMVMERIG